MTEKAGGAIRKWLCDHLTPLMNVQRCAFHVPGVGTVPVREPDVQVFTWAGVVIHIHLIDEVIKPHKIRRVLEWATDHGIPSLFIVNAALLPRDGERVEPDKWFVTLQTLVNDRAYAFRILDGQPVIQPVQFKAYTRTLVETSFGDPLLIEQIRHFRATVRHPALKGYWLVADFESDRSSNLPPIRRADYSSYEQYMPPPPPPRPEPDAQPTPRTPKTALARCSELLGVTRPANREQVKAAFRRLAFQTHPDVSALPKPEAEARFRLLSEAYEAIRSANDW
jgi:hypothetical protein